MEEFWRVAGPKDFTEVMWEMRGNPPHMADGWKGVEVVSSNGQNFGSLFEVRQAYHYWDEQHTAWTKRNSLPLPRLRVGGKKHPATHFPKRRRQ